tara:strand:+ start:6987 stop:7478 length:492 start_codon:yes stop_codon:yes gene_type:complete
LFKIVSNIDRFYTGALTTLTGLFGGVTFLAVFWGAMARYVFNAPVVWSEGLATYSMIYSVMIGAALAYRQNKEIAFEVIEGNLPAPLKMTFGSVCDIAVIVLGVLLAISGWHFAASRGSLISTGLNIPMVWAQAAIAVGGIALCLSALMRLTFRHIKFSPEAH